MADINTFPKHSLQPEEIAVSMILALDAANVPTLVEGSDFASVVRNSAGKFTITLKHKYVALRGWALGLLAPTAVDLVPQLQAADVSGAKTVVVQLLAAAVPTDPPAVGANACLLSVALVLRNTTVKGQ